MASETVRQNVDAVFGLAPMRDTHRLSLDLRVGADVERLGERRSGERPFSVFRQEDATQAAALAERLGQIADEAGPDGGLERATAAAAEVAKSAPGLARHALGIFSTHNPIGRATPIPSLLRRTATLATRDAATGSEVTLGSKSTGDEVRLDWFREDPLANEHHEHWHIVYPNRVAKDKIKQRHGELFYYMHQQMLARYDTERAAVGLAPVEPITDLTESLGAGYDPGVLETSYLRYERRDPDQTMVEVNGNRDRLAVLGRNLRQAAESCLLGPTGGQVKLEGHAGSNLLGLEAENTSLQQFQELYGNHHGTGHGLIAAASAIDAQGEDGVMADTATAIRDPVFWRWHRHVDDIHFLYQDSLDPHDFDDEVEVTIEALALQSEGSEAPVDAGPDEAQTAMQTGRYRLTNQKVYRYDYLSHEPFQLRVELDNPTGTALPVTLRVFLLPNDLVPADADPTTADGRQMRRFVIELDKVKIDVPPGKLSYVRHGRDMSVIRRPAVVDPAEVADIEPGENTSTVECTCGWPYGLLLPRGTATGMGFKLFAMLTDNRSDRIGSPKKCGSMSFCGVGDEYPDAKPMGYPFDRRLSRSVAALVAQSKSMILRDIVVRWANAPTS